VTWYVLQNGRFAPRSADQDIFRSSCFPGLWLDEAALLRGDMAAVLATLQQDMAQPEHAAFVKQLTP
jgi:hypothetical protein